MPRKTKKQKIKAQQRQYKIIFSQKPLSPAVSSPVNIKHKTETKKKIKPKKSPIQTKEDAQEERRLVSYFRQDLKRSLFLSMTLILLELAIYSVTVDGSWVF